MGIPKVRGLVAEFCNSLCPTGATAVVFSIRTNIIVLLILLIPGTLVVGIPKVRGLVAEFCNSLCPTGATAVVFSIRK